MKKSKSLSILSVIALGTVVLAGCSKSIPEEERKWGPSSEETPAQSVAPVTFSFDIPGYVPGSMPSLTPESFSYDIEKGENWWDEYAGTAGVEISDFFPMEELKEIAGVEKDLYLPFFEMPSKYVYQYLPDFGFLQVIVQGDYTGDVAYAAYFGMCVATEDASGIVTAMDLGHNYVMNIMAENLAEEGEEDDYFTAMIFQNPSEYFCTELAEEEMWTGETYENMLKVLPLGYDLMVPCGADYESFVEEDPDWGCNYFVVNDHYYKDLTDDIYGFLYDIGFEPYYDWYTDELECYYWYIAECDTEIDVSVEWSIEYGNTICFTYYYEGYDSNYPDVWDYMVPTPWGCSTSLTMLDESDVTYKSETMDDVMWNNDYVALDLFQNTSSQTVGNGSYLSNPLRIYTGQLATLAWNCDVAPTTITLMLNTKQSKSKATSLKAVSGVEEVLVGQIDSATKLQPVTLVVDYETSLVELEFTGQFHINEVIYSWEF